MDNFFDYLFEDFYNHLEASTRIAFAGDWHMNLERVDKVLDRVERMGADVVLHVGDFGYFPALEDYDAFISRLTARAKLHDYFVVFIDGNHEQYTNSRYPRWQSETILTRDGLNALRDKADENGFVLVSPRVLWATRGATAKIGTAGGKRGVSFIGCGGAGSINREFEQMRRFWSPDEHVASDDVAAVKRGAERLGGVVDIMLTHDAPSGAPVPKSRIKGSLDKVQAHVLKEAEETRQNIAEAVSVAKPSVLFHGHWHVRNNGTNVPIDTNSGRTVIPSVQSLGDELRAGDNLCFTDTRLWDCDTDELNKRLIQGDLWV